MLRPVCICRQQQRWLVGLALLAFSFLVALLVIKIKDYRHGRITLPADEDEHPTDESNSRYENEKLEEDALIAELDAGDCRPRPYTEA